MRACAQVGNDPATERIRIRSAPRIDDLRHEYRQRWSPRWKPSTLATNTRYRKHYLDAAFSGLFIDEIDDEHVITWFADLNNLSSYGAANRMFSTLNTIFTKAEEWGYRPANTNPCRAVRAGVIDDAIAFCRMESWADLASYCTRRGRERTRSGAA